MTLDTWRKPARRTWRRAAGACWRFGRDCAPHPPRCIAALIAEPTRAAARAGDRRDNRHLSRSRRTVSRRGPHAARGCGPRRRARARLRPASLAASRSLARGLSTARRRDCPPRRPRAARDDISSCASRAMACTRSRSARCTPASSSPGISVFRSSAKRCSGSRSGSATCTRASSNDSPSSRAAKAIGWRRASRAIRPSRISWAYCQALEGMAQATVPARAAWLRALALESERIANHLGDLGALGNDAGFAFGLAQFSRLKEKWLRANRAALRTTLPDGFRGARRRVRDPMRGTGSRSWLPARRTIAAESSRFARDLRRARGRARSLRGAGIVTPELAARLGLCGLAGRASGQAFDLRCDLPCAPYDDLRCARLPRAATATWRRASRCASTKLQESLRLMREIVRRTS